MIHVFKRRVKNTPLQVSNPKLKPTIIKAVQPNLPLTLGLYTRDRYPARLGGRLMFPRGCETHFRPALLGQIKVHQGRRQVRQIAAAI